MNEVQIVEPARCPERDFAFALALARLWGTRNHDGRHGVQPP